MTSRSAGGTGGAAEATATSGGGGAEDAQAANLFASGSPDEVADDWKTMQEGVQKIEQAFEDAGLALDDLDEVMSGNVPEGVDMAKLQELGTTLEELDSQEFNDASEAISKHAEEECDITLGE